jgi:AraC-like DNA-binding protein
MGLHALLYFRSVLWSLEPGRPPDRPNRLLTPRLGLYYAGAMREAHLERVRGNAPMLGFSDLSNFIRACKRWTGKTPTEFKSDGHSQIDT